MHEQHHLAFNRPSNDVQKGERKNVLGILCTQLDSGDYIATCLTEDRQLHTLAYADVKAAYQRFEQLAVSYDVEASRKGHVRDMVKREYAMTAERKALVNVMQGVFRLEKASFPVARRKRTATKRTRC